MASLEASREKRCDLGFVKFHSRTTVLYLVYELRQLMVLTDSRIYRVIKTSRRLQLKVMPIADAYRRRTQKGTPCTERL